MRTVLSGARIFAVSAMKWTPQNTIVDADERGREPGQRQRVAGVVGDVLDLGQLVVVGEQHGVVAARERAHLLGPRSDRRRDGHLPCLLFSTTSRKLGTMVADARSAHTLRVTGTSPVRNPPFIRAGCL